MNTSLKIVILAPIFISINCVESTCMTQQVNPETTVELRDLKITEIFPIHNITPQDTFNNLLQILEQMPWYKSNGYHITLPSHPIFKDLEEHPEKIKTLDQATRDKYFEIFISEIYKPLDITSITESLNKNTKLLLTTLDKLKVLNKNWGFKIFPKYKIVPEMYSPGGRYHSWSGQITLDIKNSVYGVYRNIIHEMVHLGIEEIIVQKYKLTHWEKEGLVDLICSTYLKDLLPNYLLQSSGDKKIKDFITYENICNNLPDAIKKFTEKYPRN